MYTPVEHKERWQSHTKVYVVRKERIRRRKAQRLARRANR